MKLALGKRIDATKGNLFKMILLYALPLFLSSLIQHCFSAVDVAVLGNMADSNAVASVGATTAITSLIINTFIGVASGAKIILARQFGAKDTAGIQQSVNTIIITAVGLGVLIAALGVPLAPSLLHLTKCPEECFRGAEIYIQIYIASAPAILLYNFGSAVITSSGDSQRPMLYIIISGFVNVILNVILCMVLQEKVAAVAIATITSQIVSAFLVIRRLCVMEGDGHLNLRHMSFHANAFVQLMKQGLPLALQTALYPLANLQIQSAINLHGAAAIAGNSASTTVESLSGAPLNAAFASTTTVFMGQNIGAHKLDRVKRSFWICLAVSTLSCLVVSIVVYLTGRFWLSLILPNDPAAVEFGKIRMFFVLLFYAVAAANGVLSHAIQAYGHATYSAIVSIFSVFGFRFIWMWFVYPFFENTAYSFHALMGCFTISWLLVMLLNVVGYIFFRNRFHKKLNSYRPDRAISKL